MDISITHALGAPLCVIGISHNCMSPIACFSFAASLLYLAYSVPGGRITLCFIWHEELHNHFMTGCTDRETIKCLYAFAEEWLLFLHMYDQESLSVLW
jgi:hypothetical protein